MNMLCRSVLAASILSFVSAPAIAEDLEFTLTNKSGYVIVEFYASPSDVYDWEEDILGMDVLGHNESVLITIADGRTQCEYDLRMTFDDGDTLEDTVDLCETGSYTVE